MPEQDDGARARGRAQHGQQHESGWSATAYNAGTGAYGIPQALPGAKMASAGPDWQTDAATQVRWGLEYIRGTYGSPCGAWDHEQATGWY